MGADESDENGRVVAKSRTRRAPGRIVRINLRNDEFAYGRQLAGPLVEFYDYLSKGALDIDLLQLVDKPVAFRVFVMKAAFRSDGWELLGTVTLSTREFHTIHQFFKKDPISGALSIYWEDPSDGTWGERPATAAECAKLERAAVWDREHVEDRLRDHFDGKPNVWAESLQAD
jgi:hypothetical protein